MVDSHVHLIGGGGEGGPATRTPEIRVEEIVGNGVTTVIGCLGTDGITRHASSLMAKAQGLSAEGITAYLYVGSYELPVQNLTGSVRSDANGSLPVFDEDGNCHTSGWPTREPFSNSSGPSSRVGSWSSTARRRSFPPTQRASTV
jgi:hypothetical protein